MQTGVVSGLVARVAAERQVDLNTAFPASGKSLDPFLVALENAVGEHVGHDIPPMSLPRADQISDLAELERYVQDALDRNIGL